MAFLLPDFNGSCWTLRPRSMMLTDIPMTPMTHDIMQECERSLWPKAYNVLPLKFIQPLSWSKDVETVKGQRLQHVAHVKLSSRYLDTVQGTATCSAQRQRVQYRPPEQRMPPYQPSWQVTQRRHVRTIRSSSPSVASASAASGSATAPSVESPESPCSTVASSSFSGTPTASLGPSDSVSLSRSDSFAGTSAEPDSVGATSPRRFFTSSLCTGTHARANTMTMFKSFMITMELHGCHTFLEDWCFLGQRKLQCSHDVWQWSAEDVQCWLLRCTYTHRYACIYTYIYFVYIYIYIYSIYICNYRLSPKQTRPNGSHWTNYK